MSTEIEEKLLLLHQIIFDKDSGNRQPGAVLDVKYLSYSRNETDRLFQIIEQLQSVLENSPSIDLEINISCLFNEEKGILKVLYSIMGCKELEKIKQAILKFLLEFYKGHKDRLLLQQISNSRETFLMYAISTETTAKEKELALENLQCILEMKRLMAQVEVEDTLRALCDFEVEYRNPSFRVLRGIYQSMALTCKQYKNTDPALVTRVVKVLLGVLVRQKSVNMSDHKPLVVEGCFVGMKFIMMEYEIEKDEESCLRLYGPLKHFLSIDLLTGSHRGVQRAALQLLAEHGIKLATHVYSDYEYWHETFRSWAAHKNPDLHRMGYAGLSTFYRIIAHTLKDKTGPDDKQIFQYFMQYFETTVSNKNLIKATYEVSLAIQGFGQFASPCKIHLTPRQVNEMFTNILSRAEEYLKQPTTAVQTLDYLPKYVEALGTIVAHIPSIGPQYRSTLQCLCVFLFERFPTMARYTHDSSIVALLRTFESISIKGTLIDTFLEEVVYQAIIRTCSHPVRMDADLLMEKMTPFAAYQLITYDRFLPLWEGLLQISTVSPNSDFDQDRLEVIGSKVFDAFMLSLIKIVEKLDLQTYEKTGSESMEVEMAKPVEASQPEDGSEIKEEEKNIPLLEVIGMDPETSLVASHPKDFRVLLNVVDLCNDVLPKIGKQRFCHWAHKFAQHLMIHSSQLPLVSSFYKLLTLCLKLSNEMELFKDIEKDSNTERQQCFQLLSKFLREVLTELVQYKGDLQMSCLYLVLAAPLSLVPDMLPFAKPAFQAIFSMGETYLPLASAGVSTLQNWSSNLSKETMQPLLLSTIPLLDKFLHSKDQVDGSDSPLELVELQSRKHVHFRAARKAVQSQAGERDSELSQLQRDILMFLAQLDTPMCLALVDLQDTQVAEQAVAWSSTKLLEFKVPFNDVKPVIHLDIFLPRVMELALHCSDRHTRVTACELLHSFVMYILGTSVTLPAEGKARSELSKLFRHVAPAVLALGCDQDHLVRHMFQPTMLQLAHFCSSKPQLNSHDTAVLLQTLLDGITDQVDMSLRDFSAMCLKEFVIWSIKHTPHSEMANSPVNIKRILRQMYAFSQHPCPFKRLGAALCVNSLYTVLREERDLVDQFWLELLFYLVSSLQLVGPGEAVVGTKQQTHKAIGHIERVLSEWSDFFNEPSKARRQPPDFTGVCLKDALAWLLSLCSSPHSACRVVCIKLVHNLADKVTGAASTMDGIRLCCEIFQTEFVLLEVCEGQLFGREGLLQTPALNIEAESESMRHWMQQLLASLECYTWLLENELAKPNEIFPLECQPNIFLAINKFIKIHFEDIISKYVLSPREKEEFEFTKCKVIIQILDFLYFLMTSGESSLSVPLLSSNLSEITQPLWSNEWWNILFLIVMQPTKVGFSIKTHELCKELDEKLARCLSVMPQKLPSSVFLQLKNSFNKYLQEYADELGNIHNLVDMVTIETPSNTTTYIKGCIVLRQTGISCNLNEKFVLLLENDAHTLVQKVFDCLIDEQAHTVPTIAGSNDLLNAILKLAFTFNIDIKNAVGKKKKSLEVMLLDKLNDQTTLEDDESQAFVTHGEIFLKRLKPTILEFLLEMPTEAAGALVNSPLISLPQLNLYQFILTNVYSRPHLRLRYGCEVSAMVMRDWNRIRETEETHLLEVIDLMAYVAAMSAKDATHLQHIANWLYRHLSSESHILSIKTRCLDVAPALLTWDENYRRTLRRGLDKLKQKLPLTSAEYPVGSSQCAEYKSFFLRLLALLRLTQDLELLVFVASIATREEEHICHEAIQKTLKAVMSRLPVAKQLEAIEKIFEIYMNDDNLCEVRLASINQFIIPMLQTTSSNTTEQFFLNHISYIASHVLTALKPGNSYRLQKQFATRTACWNLFQLLYTKLPADSMKATSPLGMAFSSTKKLNQELLREAYNSRKEKLDIEDEYRTLYLKYQCAAYKAVISITCSLFPQVNENIKKYSEFIFKSKDCSHWLKIIDSTQNLELRMDFDEVPEKRKKLSCIRKIAKEIRDSSSHESSEKSQTIRYLATHELFDSTLCEDVTRFDLSHVDVRSYAEPNETENNSEEIEKKSDPGQEEVLLELDVINKHDCMATLCALIRHLSSSNPTPAENPQPPDWMKCLKEDLLNDSFGRNIKLFIIKLIMNVEEVFRPYAKFWIEPICSVIAQKSIGNTVNYIISDAIIMITSWHEVAIPTSKVEAVQASDVLTFLIENSYHPRRDILRHNLELIKTIVEIWKPCISLNYQLLFNMIQPSKVLEQLELGLQIAAILIANKLTPWNDIGKENYIEYLLDSHLMNTTAKIYKIASEIIGMILKWSHDYPQIGIPNLREKTRKNLNILIKEKGIFYKCLYIIHKHFSPIVDTFLNTIIFQYPNNLSEMKTNSLEMICSRIEQLDDQYKETKNLGLIQLLTSKAAENQEMALKIVAKLVLVMTPVEALPYVSQVPQIIVQCGPDSRKMSYLLLMEVYRKHNAGAGPEQLQLKQISVGGLLRGLCDPDEALQQLVLQFWTSDAVDIPMSTVERFIALTKMLFYKEHSNLFLSNCVELLLEAASNTPDYNELIFLRGLTECKFTKYSLLASWRTQHAAMTPMFAETLTSQIASKSLATSSMAAGMLRATQQTFAFKPTVQEQEPETQDTEGLLFSTDTKDEETEEAGKIAKPKDWKGKYRFMSDEKRHRIFFAQREMRLSSRRQQVMKEQKAKTQGKVHMYREYRAGDFPDIQIPHSAVIKPLQALAKRDASIARQLFVSLFIGIAEKRVDSNFISDIETHLRHIFEENARCVPMLMGAVMEIALDTDLELQPNIISDVCTTNSLAPMGCLLLEKYLSSDMSSPSPAKRRRISEEEAQELRQQQKWLRMAELYQSLEERDIVLAVFQQALDVEQSESQSLVMNNVVRAVENEATQHWTQAQAMYRNFLDTSHAMDSIKDFSTEAYCKCLEKLSQWSEMNTWVREEISPDGILDPVWTDSWNQEKLLPWLMKSEIHEILEMCKDEHDFIPLMSDWLGDSNKVTFLKSHYSEELSLLSLMTGEVEKARFHSRYVLQSFLEDWSVLSKLLPRLRAQKLGQLQTVAEIIVFAEARITDDELEYVKKMKELCQKWDSSKPSPVDSLLFWESRTEYRCYFASNAREKLQMLKTRDDSLKTELKKAPHLQELNLIDLAIQQKNLKVAEKFLLKNKKLKEDPELSLPWKITLSRAKWLLAEISSSPVDKLKCTLVALDEIRQAVESSEGGQLPGMRSRAERELAELAWAAASLLSEHEDLAENQQIVRLLSNFTASDVDGIVAELEAWGQTQAELAVQTAQQEAEQGAAVTPADAMLCVVRHCRELIKSDTATQGHLQQLVTCLLGAMKCGSRKARMLFPCLLQVESLGTDKDLQKLFAKEAASVPAWMFLGWTNQLLAHVNTNKVNAVNDLLLRMATEYPKALMLPFQFTLEKIEATVGTPSDKTKQLVDRLTAIVEPDVMMSRMLKALSYIAQPEIAFKGYLTNISKVLEKPDQLKKLYKEMCSEIFPEISGDLPTAPLHGKIYDNFHLKHKSALDKVLKPLMNKPASPQKMQSIVKTLKTIYEKNDADIASNQSNRYRNRMLLKLYSPWLDQFHRSKYNCEIELPGQYTGEKMPRPQYHVTFSSFDAQVLIMSSLRRPVKITVVGNDGCSYGFLVKSGEDLRQDERVQQLFGVMNEVLRQDPRCTALKLHINTYQVVPLNSHLGIIEFVKDCMPYGDFIQSNATELQTVHMKKAKSSYTKWAESKANGAKAPSVKYDSLYMKYSQKTATDYFTALLKKMPENLLKQAFSRVSSSPEGLFWLRQSFASSVGVMNVAQWLLGIGDRHLSNMLVSQRTGAALGIDFGHAFGSATQMLPVPELVPFRLTEYMLSLMGPLRHSGLIRASMVHSLRALRCNSELLLNTMQVFVQEPSLDWQENASKLAENFAYDSGASEVDPATVSQEIQNYAEQKVRLTLRKIEGALPVVVSEKELVTGRKNSAAALPFIVKVLRGDDNTLRSKLRDRACHMLEEENRDEDLDNLATCSFTPEQQVDCLIEQATDYSILARTWEGWESWV